MQRVDTPITMKQNEPKIAPPLGVLRNPEERMAPISMITPRPIEEMDRSIFVPVLTMNKIGQESYFMAKPTFS